MKRIDLNCDLGEGAGIEAEVMPGITSANIACGAHAGDDATMRRVAELAGSHGVNVGAHPGFADRENFGRVERPVAGTEAAQLVLEQLERWAAVTGRVPAHVKLHGALYHQVAREPELAEAVATALVRDWPQAAVYAPAGSALARIARARGLRVAEEVFADRSYRADGTLRPRSEPGATIADVARASSQARQLALTGKATAADGSGVALRADTLCLHGDGPEAVALARRLREDLTAAGVVVRAFGT